MSKYPDIDFDTLGGGGILCIHLYPGPYGDAVEDLTLNGVGWFSSNEQLLAAQFDHVDAENDRQILKFNNRFKNLVEVTVKNGKVTFKVSSWKSPYKNAAKAA